MGKLRTRKRTNKNRLRSAKNQQKIINMKGCSNSKRSRQKGGCGCSLFSGGSKRMQRGGAWSAWNPTSGGEFFAKNMYNDQPDYATVQTNTTLGSEPFSGGGRSRQKGRKLKSKTAKDITIRNYKGLNKKGCPSHKMGACNRESQQQEGGGNTESIFQEVTNFKGGFMDMLGNAYTSYKGIDTFPSSVAYKGHFASAV